MVCPRHALLQLLLLLLGLVHITSTARRHTVQQLLQRRPLYWRRLRHATHTDNRQGPQGIDITIRRQT
jgi:hypothetical protein